MAKKAMEKTPAQLATLDARQKAEVARKAHTDKATDANKKAMDAAEAHLKKCVATENRERFVRVAGGRVKKARAAIRNLAAVAAPRSYAYSDDDVNKAEAAISAEVKSCIAKMRAALTRGASAAKQEDDFSFS